jgi:hypothetical protein
VRRALVLGTVLLAAAALSAAATASSKLHVSVTAQGHHPVVGKTWTYEVACTAAGKPVPCSVHIQVFFSGASVGEIGKHVLKNGVWKETIPAKGKNAFPVASVGQPLVWHVIATAKGYGTGVGTYPISVVK